MAAELSFQSFQERTFQSELGQIFANEPLLPQDIWALSDLGYSEESQMRNRDNLLFCNFSLPWLKLLTKLTVLARTRQKHSLALILTEVYALNQLDEFLRERGYIQPNSLTDNLLRDFITSSATGEFNRHRTIMFATRLWSEEGWLKISFTPSRLKKCLPKIEIIPEEVLHQVYENFDLFPPMLERLFRLQIALGCRIGEMLVMPYQCLKREEDRWFLLRWIEKRKEWKFFQVHPLVSELVQSQQKFIKTELGNESKFDKLFCWLSTAMWSGSKNKSGTYQSCRFEMIPVYQAKPLTCKLICLWLKAFSEVAELRDKQGNHFSLHSHMFRRTKASIMAHCETEDEYIASVLGHASLEMLPHYRKRSLERLENVAQTKAYVDMYGRVTTFKPRKRRYEKLAELLKVSTPLGECHRPVMLGDCQARYACLSCIYHRVTEEDQPQLEADRQYLQQDLEQAETAGQQRRIIEIQRLLALVNNRLQGLSELQLLIEEQKHEI